jgi:hypothetical protein
MKKSKAQSRPEYDTRACLALGLAIWHGMHHPAATRFAGVPQKIDPACRAVRRQRK